MFKKKKQLVITSTKSITSVGHSSELTAASVNSGVSKLSEDSSFFDYYGNPIVVSRIEGVSKNNDDFEFMLEVNEKCFIDLIETYYEKLQTRNEIYIIMGGEHKDKPTFKDNQKWEKHIQKLMSKALEFAPKVTYHEINCGNPSALYAISHADSYIRKNPNTTFIIGSMDSLLYLNNLNYLDDNKRLKSRSFGQNHGMSPSQASGFTIIEEKEYALKNNRIIQAEVKAVSSSEEPAPLAKGEPSKFFGLTDSVNKIFKESKIDKKNISTIFSDLNGEYYRSKEWSFVKVRCLKDMETELVHPADCFGSIGAAYGSVLINMATEYLSEKWIEKDAMILCSDDYGFCGSLVLSGFKVDK